MSNGAAHVITVPQIRGYCEDVSQRTFKFFRIINFEREICMAREDKRAVRWSQRPSKFAFACVVTLFLDCFMMRSMIRRVVFGGISMGEWKEPPKKNTLYAMTLFCSTACETRNSGTVMYPLFISSLVNFNCDGFSLESDVFLLGNDACSRWCWQLFTRPI